MSLLTLWLPRGATQVVSEFQAIPSLLWSLLSQDSHQFKEINASLLLYNYVNKKLCECFQAENLRPYELKESKQEKKNKEKHK